MTLDDIRKMTKGTISPAEAASVIGCDPFYIRLMARQSPENLGFPVIVYNSRTKIPREAFIAFMEGKAAVEKVRE